MVLRFRDKRVDRTLARTHAYHKKPLGANNVRVPLVSLAVPLVIPGRVNDLTSEKGRIVNRVVNGLWNAP